MRFSSSYDVRRIALALAPVLALALAAMPLAQAQTYTVLYTFTGGTDGSAPLSTPILYNGTVYGTAAAGRTRGNGTVYGLTQEPQRNCLALFHRWPHGRGRSHRRPGAGSRRERRLGEDPARRGTLALVQPFSLRRRTGAPAGRKLLRLDAASARHLRGAWASMACSRLPILRRGSWTCPPGWSIAPATPATNMRPEGC